MRRILLALTLIMATGTVELVGTQIGTAGSFGGDPSVTKDKALDGDFTTYSFSPSGSGGDWIGVDAGVACTLVEVRFAPIRGNVDNHHWELNIVGSKVQVSSDPTFATDRTDVDTIPSSPYYPSYQMNRRSIAGAPSKRYVRWTHPSDYVSLAELRFIANAGPTAAKPVAPVISQPSGAKMGGRYPSGSVAVTLSSGTTSADLYYTTDGSTPTSGSAHYTGPFTLTIGGSGTTLKVIAIDSSLDHTDSDVVSADFKPWGYKPREDWKDDRGILVEAHSGGFLKGPGGYPLLVSGKYWWCGTLSNAYSTISLDSNGMFGVWLYSTTDFRNFVFEGQIVENPFPVDTGIILRPHMLYNSPTAKYVLWAITFSAERVLIATADHPAGPWTVQTTTYNPDSLGCKDMHLYHATDGRAFVTRQNSAADKIYITQLAPADFLSVTGTPSIAHSGGREAPVLGQDIDDTFFLHTSVPNYYDDSLTFDQRVKTTTDPLVGTWSANNAAFASDPLGTAYNGQSTDAVRFSGGILMLFDAWISRANQYGFRQIWLPYRSGVVETPTAWDPSDLGFTPPGPARIPWLRA